jgi:hypothetical protein
VCALALESTGGGEETQFGCALCPYLTVYGLLFRLTQDGVYFVTRQTVNAKCQVTAHFAVNWLQGMTSDQNIVLRGENVPAYPDGLRRGNTVTRRPTTTMCPGPMHCIWPLL